MESPGEPGKQRPLIAISGYVAPPDEGAEPRLVLRERYPCAVLAAGGIPLVAPPVGGATDARRLVEQVDGLLLTGGDDFDMDRLGRGATHPAATPTFGPKQDHDFALARAAAAEGLPVLGICYGMQVLCLAAGGALLQHLPEDRPGGRDHTGGTLHDVVVSPGTKLASALGVERLPVISSHHQAISDPGHGFAVCARDDEGLIEAVEGSGDPFAVGVQWHPELSPESSPHGHLFRAFVAAAAARRANLTADPAPA